MIEPNVVSLIEEELQKQIQKYDTEISFQGWKIGEDHCEEQAHE